MRERSKKSPKHWSRLSECVAVALCLAGLIATPGSAVARDQTEVLRWDDGECDLGVGSAGATALGVWFQAPQWANSVVGIHVFVADCGDTTTPPFTTRMWAPTGDWPYSPGPQVGPILASTEYSEGSWVLFPFSEPVRITDPGEFPDRVFFVGVVWECTTYPLFGVDWDVPLDAASWMSNGSEWSPFEVGDIMVRAVVSDDTSTVVARGSWGWIKSLYVQD